MAFNLAERYQMPVLLLSDQSLSSRTESIARPDLENVEVWDRITPENAGKYAQLIGRNGHGSQAAKNGHAETTEQSEGNRNEIAEDPSGDPVYIRHETALLSYGIDLTHVPVDRVPPPEKFVRYAVTESGISPMSIPGMRGDTRYVSTGIEHDQLADPNYTAEYHTLMTNKRFRKLTTAIDDLGDTMLRRFGVEDPDVLVVAWGSTAGPAREAVERAIAAGGSVGMIVPLLLWPLVPSIGAALAKAKKIIIPEMNFAGQFARLLRAEFGGDRDRMIEVHKYTGLPFTAAEIENVIKEAEVTSNEYREGRLRDLATRYSHLLLNTRYSLLRRNNGHDSSSDSGTENGRTLPFQPAPDLVRGVRRLRRPRGVLRSARRDGRG